MLSQVYNVKAAPIIATKAPKLSPRRSAPFEFLGGVADVVLLAETEVVVVPDFEVGRTDSDVVDAVNSTVVVVFPTTAMVFETIGITEVVLDAAVVGKVLIIVPVEDTPPLYDGLLMPNCVEY
jgi:hypothetical protein